MADPLTRISTRRTPQTEPIPGRTDQVPNSAGGYAFATDQWQRLNRFLILGTEGGTYYIRERELTKENADIVLACLDEAPARTLEAIRDVSLSGRAPKPQPAIFALAVAAGHPKSGVRTAALNILSDVCRTGTHLFTFLNYVENFRGWGRGLRRAVGDWYLDKSPRQVAYQVTKYAQRNGWSHRDALRLAKPRPQRGLDMDAVLAYATGKFDRFDSVTGDEGSALQYLRAVDAAKTADRTTLRWLIAEHHMPWEVVPSEALNDPKTWDVLVPSMGMTALVRNLGRLTSIGYIQPMSIGSLEVVRKLTNEEAIRESRIHPLQILTAEATYRRGAGVKGSLSWKPEGAILDALDTAFYASFGNVEPSNKRTLIALDVSGSMGWGQIAGSPLTPREGAAALALLWMNTEPLVTTMAFSDQFMHLPIQKKMTLGNVIDMTSGLPFRGTDCSLPMQWAQQHQLDIDHFVVITDNETWAGRVHPTQALQEYRRHRVPDAKLSVVGMVSNGFTIADPKDPGMLDVVGFDTATPNLIAEFARGF